MPYLKIQTNARPEAKDISKILAEASALVASLLGKPEAYMAANFQAGQEMIFGGTDAPCAFVELKSLGLSASQGEKLSSALCGFLERRLGISPERVYIEMSDHPGNLWGWNGGTFA